MERWRESLTRRAPQVVAIIVRATDIHLGYTAPATNLMHLLKEHNPWVPLFETKETNRFFLFFSSIYDIARFTVYYTMLFNNKKINVFQLGVPAYQSDYEMIFSSTLDNDPTN